MRKFDRGSKILNHLPNLSTPEAALPHRENVSQTNEKDNSEDETGSLLKRVSEDEPYDQLTDNAAKKPTWTKEKLEAVRRLIPDYSPRFRPSAPKRPSKPDKSGIF